MSIVLGLVVLAVLIGFVCYNSQCSVRAGRSLPKEISERLNTFS